MPTRVRELVVKARGLSRRERGELARAWVELPAVWLALRLVSVRRMLGMRRGAQGSVQRDRSGADEAREAARLVSAAARFSPFPSTCLSRSIVLLHLLRRRGLAAEIKIGVLRDRSPLAHAWVEVNGEPVNDTADVADRHAVFERSLVPKT
jgi:hypothetical protein